MKIKPENKYKDISVLLFGATGRQVLPVLKGFYEIGCDITVYCKKVLDLGNLSRYANHKIIHNSKSGFAFNEMGKRIIKQGNFDLVVPLGDESALFLSKNKDELSHYSKIAVNDYSSFMYAIDKSKTMKICRENDIPAPKTFDMESLDSNGLLNRLSYPVVVKPKTAVGSIGFNIVNDAYSLERLIKKYNNEYGPLLIQDYIKQDGHSQYRVDLFRDRNGVYKAAVVGEVMRWYPLDGGSGIFIVSIHNDKMVNNCKKLLDAIDWNGYANIDLVWDSDNDIAKIVEINGRLGASVKQDYVSGINISQLILENEMGYEVTDMNYYEDGAQVSCFAADVLWLLKSPNRFKTQPSWFDRKRIIDTVFSLDDPLPSIGFVINTLLSMKKSFKQRKRIKE